MNREREKIHKIMFRKYDRRLDTSTGPRWLAISAVAEIIRENLYHHHASLYQLLAYSIMPNHVHLIIQPFESDQRSNERRAMVSQFRHGCATQDIETDDRLGPLSKIMHALKSYTANRANQYLLRFGAFWQRESFDHWVRDVEELERIVDYVNANPVRAGLCRSAEHWQFSSAFDRFHKDGSKCGLVGWLTDDWRKKPADP